MLEAAFVAGMASEGVVVHRLGVVPTPAVAFEAQPPQRHRRGDLGLAQPLPRQRHQAVRPRRHRSCPTRSRSASSARSSPCRRRAASRPSCSTPRRAPTTSPTSSTPSTAGRSPGCASSSTAPTARPASSPPASSPPPAPTSSPSTTRPNGRNINDRCGATHLDSLAAAVVVEGADLGLALDGDADRLLAVDHTGRVVDGDHIMAICATDLHRRGALRDVDDRRHGDVEPRLPPGDGARRDPRRRDPGRRPLRARGARRGRLHDGRRAERSRHLPRPGDDRRRAAHRRAARRRREALRTPARRPRRGGDDAAAAGAASTSRSSSGSPTPPNRSPPRSPPSRPGSPATVGCCCARAAPSRCCA